MHTRREDAGPNHLIDIEENDGEPPYVISQRGVRLDRRADSFLVGRPRAIAAFHTGKGEITIMNYRRLRVGGIRVVRMVCGGSGGLYRRPWLEPVEERHCVGTKHYKMNMKTAMMMKRNISSEILSFKIIIRYGRGTGFIH